MRLYLDEMYPPAIAEMVRASGVEIISSHKCGRDGFLDEDVLTLAGDDGRCVVTDNHQHFVRLTLNFYAESRPHAGVVLVPTSVEHHHYARLAAAIVRFARENPQGLQPYEIRWLTIAFE